MDRRSLLAAGASGVLATATAQAQPASAPAPTQPAPAGGTPGLRTRAAVAGRHTTQYLEGGDPRGPAIVFVHGWPETSLAWRHQLRTFADLGFRVLAPDLRGCGGSTVHPATGAYSLREIVGDMLALADDAGLGRAVWVGHDWGATVAWSLASHHPERCNGVAALCVPYDTLERGLARMATLVNRDLYPAAEFPAGQYEYMALYHERFDEVRQLFDAHPEALLKVLLRRGDPQMAGKPFPTASVRRQGGWFGPGRPPPDVPLDPAVLDEATLQAYAAAYRRTGFFGINALYMNDRDNASYTDEAPRRGAIDLPALFLAGRYDYVNDTAGTGLTGSMQAKCGDLSMATLACGHWMQNEQPAQVSAALAWWLARRIPQLWPVRPGRLEVRS